MTHDMDARIRQAVGRNQRAITLFPEPSEGSRAMSQLVRDIAFGGNVTVDTSAVLGGDSDPADGDVGDDGAGGAGDDAPPVAEAEAPPDDVSGPTGPPGVDDLIRTAAVRGNAAAVALAAEDPRSPTGSFDGGAQGAPVLPKPPSVDQILRAQLAQHRRIERSDWAEAGVSPWQVPPS